MTRKTGGPPTERIEEEPWQPPEAEEPLQRSLDLALRRVGESSDQNDEEEPEFLYGDIVHDTEVDEPIALVVVNVPEMTPAEWAFDDGETLADKNPKCPEDDDVIVVVPLGLMNDYMPDWDTRREHVPLMELIEDDIPYAPFPSLRLVRVEDSHLRS